MDARRVLSIRGKARETLVDLYGRRQEIWLDPPSPLDMIEPSIIARLWGLDYQEPEEIYFGDDSHPDEKLPSRIAGFMDPLTKRIAVARSLSLGVRRFTAAHELAHYDLHANEQQVLFRDLPVSGAERSFRNRPIIEKEADAYAAELLMPEKLLCKEFHWYFGTESLAGTKPSKDLTEWLTIGTGRKVTIPSLEAGGTRYLALLLAVSLPWHGKEPCLRLHKLFRVSKPAMAIQLEILGLV